MIKRLVAATFREPNKEAREEERLHSPIRQKDRRADYQMSDGRFKKARIARDFIPLNTTVKWIW